MIPSKPNDIQYNTKTKTTLLTPLYLDQSRSSNSRIGNGIWVCKVGIEPTSRKSSICKTVSEGRVVIWEVGSEGQYIVGDRCTSDSDSGRRVLLVDIGQSQGRSIIGTVGRSDV